jgi:protein ImuB
LELIAHHDLGDETADLGLLASIGAKLIARLIEDLRKHQIRVPWFECALRHLDRGMTIERIHFVDPTQDERRFIRLLTDRLERLRLVAPVISMSLRAGPAEAAVADQGTMFGRDGDAPSEDGLIERLLARLGAGSLRGIALVDEHRPEAAWIESRRLLRQKRRPPLAVGWASQRPLWLLAVPKRLSSTADNLPCYRSREPLRLEHGPERIESGWWDDGEIGRDYYVASGAHGVRLWIFQDRYTSRGWYLHGYFG